MITKPMQPCLMPDNLESIRYPILLSPLLTGDRLITGHTGVPLDGNDLSKVFKDTEVASILNSYSLPAGLDGIVTETEEGNNFMYNVYDLVISNRKEPYVVRYFNLLNWFMANQYTNTRINIVLQCECTDRQNIELNKTFWQKQGYKGVMLRSPEGLYLGGQINLKDQTLMEYV